MFCQLVALSVLLTVAGCSGPSTEDALEEGTPGAIPETETAGAPTQAPQVQAPQPRAAAPAATGQTAPVQQQVPGPNTAVGSAPPAPRETPSFPPPGPGGAATDANQLTGAPVEQARALPPAPTMMTVPEGSAISVILIDALSSAENQAGDEFRASLVEPIVVDGQIVVDEGVTFRGRVVDVSESGRVRGRANIQLVLTHILPLGDPIAISTRAFMEEAETDVGRDATLGGIGAAVGGAIGALTGGRRGAAIGAVAGGAGTVAATRGNELEYPAETGIVFELDRAVELPRIRPSELSTGQRLDF